MDTGAAGRAQLSRIVYIAGHARTGSTAFELALAHLIDGAVAVGELSHLPALVVDQGQCTRGHDIGACPTWAPVVDTFTGEEMADFARLRTAVESSVLRIGVSASRESAVYLGYVRRLFNEIFSRTGARCVVDSSKSQEFSRNRLAVLGLLKDEYEIDVVHLRRSLMSTVRSAYRSKGAHGAPDRPAIVRAAITPATYWLSHRAARRLSARANLDTKTIDFDGFLRQRSSAIGPIGALSSRSQPGVLAGLAGEIPAQCGIAGNVMRSYKPISIHFEDETK